MHVYIPDIDSLTSICLFYGGESEAVRSASALHFAHWTADLPLLVPIPLGGGHMAAIFIDLSSCRSHL